VYLTIPRFLPACAAAVPYDPTISAGDPVPRACVYGPDRLGA